MQSYLPRKEGRILCGMFDCKKNPRAPYEIEVGGKPRVIAGAELLAQGGYSIPLFLKRKSNQWEYTGNYRCNRYSNDTRDLYPLNPARRVDAVGVLFLQITFVTPSAAISEYMAQEGKMTLQSHYIRERDPSLAAIKRRLQLQELGHLRCACCGLTSMGLPKSVGEKCFEVHHVVPLSERNSDSLTRLSDLEIVCANCHRMLHASKASLSISELRTALEK